MANENKISQIQVGSVTYDIHDAAALSSNADANYALAIKDQSNESNILTVGWDGTLEAGGEVKGVASQATMPIESAAASCGTHMAVRNGNQVTLYVVDLKLAAALANGSATGTVLTIPAGYRPPCTSYAHLVVAGSNVGGSYARVGTDSLVTIRNQSGASIATTTNIAFTLTYVI